MNSWLSLYQILLLTCYKTIERNNYCASFLRKALSAPLLTTNLLIFFLTVFLEGVLFQAYNFFEKDSIKKTFLDILKNLSEKLSFEIPLGKYFWIPMTLHRFIQSRMKNLRWEFFSLAKNLPKLPVTALNFPRKKSNHLFLLKRLKQKISGKPFKFLMQLMTQGIPESNSRNTWTRQKRRFTYEH